jgi:hypothetical protein
MCNFENKSIVMEVHKKGFLFTSNSNGPAQRYNSSKKIPKVKELTFMKVNVTKGDYTTKSNLWVNLSGSWLRKIT